MIDGDKLTRLSTLRSPNSKPPAAAVIDRIKAGDCLAKAELDREWRARLQLIQARKRVERLGLARVRASPKVPS